MPSGIFWCERTDERTQDLFMDGHGTVGDITEPLMD